MKHFCIYLAISILGCSASSVSPPELGPGHTHARGQLVVAGDAAGTPLIRQLAQAFRAKTGLALHVEAPIGAGGARLALRDRHIDGAIVVTHSHQPIEDGCVSLAQTEVVVALGPGIQNRDISVETVREVIAGTEKTWANGMVRNFILRSSDDPVQVAYAQARSPLSTEIKNALTERRWPIVYPADDPAQRISVRPGAIGFALLGNLKLRGLPVWTARPKGYPTPFMDIRLCTRRDSKTQLRAFLAYIDSEDGRQLLHDRGFTRAGKSVP